MKLLVVTPTLGRSPFLRETVESVAALDSAVIHRLVAPPSVVNELRRAYPHLEVLGDDASGVYAAIIRGVAAEGDWDAWTWLNDDDRWCRGGARRALERLRADASADIVYGRVHYMDENGRPLGPLPIENIPTRLAALFAARIPALSQHGTLVRRTLTTRLGGLDQRYWLAADFDVWARAAQAGARFAFVDEVVAEYRLRPGQLSGDTSRMHAEIEASAHAVFGPISTWRRGILRVGFRLRHLPDLATRFLATGCFRTSSLQRRAARRTAGP